MKQREILLPQLPAHDDTDSTGFPVWDTTSMLAFARKCVQVDRKLSMAETVSGELRKQSPKSASAIKISLVPRDGLEPS